MITALLVLLIAPALAQDADDEPALRVHGNIKSFLIAADPPEWVVVPEEAIPLLEAQGLTASDVLRTAGFSAEPYTQGTAVARLEGVWQVSERTRVEVHEVLGIFGKGGGGLAGANTGAVLGAPELVPLTWTPDTGSQMGVQLRTDRLVLSTSVPGLDVSVGRQPVTLGSGLVFTPMDLVNPFSPAIVDTEYKPGVDALRVDGYIGMAGQVTVVAAWAGDGPIVGNQADDDVGLDDAILVATGRGTVRITDLVGFAGLVRGEPVLGASVVTSVGSVGVHGDATLTVSEDDGAFARAVLGGSWASAGGTTLFGEAYVQTLGSGDPGSYFERATGERFARGELWQMGRTYAALGAGHEITPLLLANVAVVANLEDPSAFVAPSVDWSVAENASVGLGGYIGLGERADTVELPLTGELTEEQLGESLKSEFGLYPPVLFVSARAYF